MSLGLRCSVLTWVRRLNTNCFVFLYDAFAERMHATKRPWACTVLVRERFTETLFSGFGLFNSLSIDDGLCLML
jgi:hypothetical protein